jgi:hypothetical protein
MPDAASTPPAATRSTKLFVAAVVVATSLLALWVFRGGQQPTQGEAPAELPAALRLPPLEPDSPKLQATWDEDARLARERGERPEDAALLSEFEALNRANLLASRGGPPVPLDQTRSFARNFRNWFGQSGVEGLRALSVPAWERFEAGFVSLQQRAADMQRTPLSLLAKPEDPSMAAYADACGEFLDMAVTLGLADSAGVWTAPDTFRRILFRYRWMSQAREQRPLDELVTPAELDAFWRWRAERAPGVSRDARMRYVDDVVRSRGDYFGVDAGLARAAVLAARGEFNIAATEVRSRTGDDAADRELLARQLDVLARSAGLPTAQPGH